ncbi:MAG: OmpA family protein [Desulfonatronovibrionaceae bacterium]
MKKKILCIAGLLVFTLAGTALASGGAKIPKVDNFYVLVDASGSMGEEYAQTGQEKVAVAKDILEKMNELIPELDYNGALFRFAPLKEIQPLLPYDSEGMQGNIDALPENVSKWFGYPTPLREDMMKMAQTMPDKDQGKTAVIIFSDGGFDKDEGAVQAVRELDSRYPDAFCFYAVSLADRAQWDKKMREVAEVNSCSRMYSASCFENEDMVSGLVREIFYDYAPDADKDGVIDEKDRCPDTPAGAEVDEHGCALDDDNDGVINLFDQCPDTPDGVQVNSVGCEVDISEQAILIDAEAEALFEVDSVEIVSDYFTGQLDEVAEYLSANPRAIAMVEAYTDSTGSAEYNQKLSEKRASAVKKYLEEKGIDSGRISTVGMGESQPVEDNDTYTGRRQNRRAVINVITP